MRKKQRRVEAESEEIVDDPTWGRVQIDWPESVWKALGIICKAPPLWNQMGAQTPVCSLSSLPKTCQWSGYAEKIGHYQTHLLVMDESLAVSRYILPMGCFIHGKSQGCMCFKFLFTKVKQNRHIICLKSLSSIGKFPLLLVHLSNII